jgi:hypothetical protein
MAKKDEMLLAVNNAIDELNELRKKKSIVEVTERMTSTSKGSEWSAWASNDDKYKALLLETKTLYEIFESVVASLAEIRKRPVDTNTSSPAAAGASPLVSVDEENAGVEDSEVTHTKLSDITEVTYNGTTYKKYSAKSYAGLSTEVQYHELWDTLLKEIEDLFPIAVMAIQQANQLHVDKSHNYDVPNKANFTRDAKFLNWSDQWNKGPAAVNIQMNALMRDVNVLFMSIALIFFVLAVFLSLIFFVLAVFLLLHHGWKHAQDDPETSLAQQESCPQVCYFQLSDVFNFRGSNHETWIIICLCVSWSCWSRSVVAWIRFHSASQLFSMIMTVFSVLIVFVFCMIYICVMF